MEILLGLKCDRCGREFDVPPDSSTVQCPGCGSWVSTAARGLGPVSSDTTSVQLSSDSKRILKVSHQWDYDYVGEYHTVKGSQYLNLYYEQCIAHGILRRNCINGCRHSIRYCVASLVTWRWRLQKVFIELECFFRRKFSRRFTLSKERYINLCLIMIF